MNTPPLVTIVIPTYNQVQFLADAIDSVIAQTYGYCEIIVVNDGSTDDTQTLLGKYSEINVLQQQNRGLSAARNAGIAQACGQYIALLDSDDIMEPERIQTQLKFLEENPNIDVLYTAMTVIDEEGNPLNTVRREVVPVDQFLPYEFFRNLVPSPSTILAKAKVFRNELFNETYRLGEDLEWIIRAAHYYNFYYIDQPLTLYRRHQRNMSEKLDELRVIELKLLKQYGVEHILNRIDQSTVVDKDLLKGKILYNMEEFDDAVEYLNRSSDPLSSFYLGNVLFEQQQYDSASKYYKKSLSKDPGNAACHNNYGLCCLKVGKGDEANQAFTKAQELRPGYLDPKNKSFTRRELRKDLLPYRNC